MQSSSYPVTNCGPTEPAEYLCNLVTAAAAIYESLPHKKTDIGIIRNLKMQIMGQLMCTTRLHNMDKHARAIAITNSVATILEVALKAAVENFNPGFMFRLFHSDIESKSLKLASLLLEDKADHHSIRLIIIIALLYNKYVQALPECDNPQQKIKMVSLGYLSQFNLNNFVTDNVRDRYATLFAEPVPTRFIKLHPWSAEIDKELIAKPPRFIIKTWGKSIVDACNQLGYSRDQRGKCHGAALTISAAFWVSILGFPQDGMVAFLKFVNALNNTKPAELKDIPNLEAYITKIFLFQNTQHINQTIRPLLANHDETPSESRIRNHVDGLLKPEVLGEVIPESTWRVTVATWTGVYSEFEIQSYLRKLTQFSNNAPFELLLHCGNHMVSLCYCPTKGEWIFSDTNHTAPTAIFPYSLEELAKLLKQKLFGERFVTIANELITIPPFVEMLKKMMDDLALDTRWIDIHSMNPAKASVTSTLNVSALYIAADAGDVTGISQLLKHGAPLEAVRKQTGETAVFRALRSKDATVLRMLLDAGANPAHISLADRDTPIHAAAQYGNEEAVKLLLEKRVNIQIATIYDTTPLSIAASLGYIKIVKLLFEYDNSIISSPPQKICACPLMMASRHGHAAIVDYLLENGYQVNTEFHDGYCALMETIINGHTNVMKVLLAHHVDLNVALLINVAELKSCIFSLVGENKEIMERITTSFDKMPANFELTLEPLALARLIHGTKHSIVELLDNHLSHTRVISYA